MSSNGASAPPARAIDPSQELDIIKLILNLRQLGDADASEKLRSRVRKVLLESIDDEEAMAKVDELIGRAKKLQSRLDGTYEAKQERKRRRREENMERAARFVDLEAETDDDDDESDGSVENEENAAE